MRCEVKVIVRPADQLDAAQDGEVVPGLAEWLSLQDWRANWRPETDPARTVDELAVVFRRAMRAGYAAYLASATAMPELFALDSCLAGMWQEGFAAARQDAGLGVLMLPA